MLKQRILTAAILIPLVLAGILFLPTSILAAVFGVFVLQGSWEWSRMAGLQQMMQRSAYVLLTAISLLFAWKGFNNNLSISQVFYIALFWWMVALVWVFNPALCKAHHLVAKGTGEGCSDHQPIAMAGQAGDRGLASQGE